MEIQEQLDQQFGLGSTSMDLDPGESNSIAMSKDIQSLRENTTESAPPFPGDDQATTTAMNSIALKHGPRQDQTLQVSKGNSMSTSPKSRRNPASEPPPARSRKRKSLEPPETEIAPHRAVAKNVLNQLIRPSDPLNVRKLQSTSYHNPSGNKYDFPVDSPTSKVLPNKPEAKKARGRPRKKVPEALLNKDLAAHRALPPQVTHAESSLHPQRSRTGEPRTAPLEEAQEESLEQRRTELVGDQASNRVAVPGSVLGSEQDSDSVDIENEESTPSDEDSSHHVRSSESAPSDYDEKNQSSENEDMTYASEVENLDNEDFELFGGIKPWRKIIMGLKRILGVSTRRPKIRTKTALDSITLTQELASLYREVGSWSERDPNHETVKDRLRTLRRELNNAIGEISESKAPMHELQNSYLVQDIYDSVIPSMVFMLHAALICRSRHYSEPDDIECLEEVIEIQVHIIRLCEKARRWKAKPISEEPIIGAVTKTVLPSMRILEHECFSRELARRTDAARQRAWPAKFAESQRRFQEHRELEKQRNRRELLERRRMMHEPFEERPRARDSRPQQTSHVNEISRAHRRSHSTTSDQWTREQNEDLVQGLLSQESRDLPGQSALVL